MKTRYVPGGLWPLWILLMIVAALYGWAGFKAAPAKAAAGPEPAPYAVGSQLDAAVERLAWHQQRQAQACDEEDRP